MIATKVVSYHDQHLEDDLILLVIEIFACLHQHDDFLHQCANMAWLAKGSGSLHLLILQAKGVNGSLENSSCHLSCGVVVVGEAFSKFNVLPSFFLVFLHNLFLVTSDGFKSQFFFISPFKAPHCEFLHFWMWSIDWTSILPLFFYNSLVECFSFIYLYKKKTKWKCFLFFL